MVRSRRGLTVLSLLLFVACAVVAVRVGRAALEPYWDFWRYRDRMRQELRLGEEMRSDAAVIASVQAYADSLGLPPAARRVQLTREAGGRRIAATYVDSCPGDRASSRSTSRRPRRDE